MRKSAFKKGFTLIELLVAMVVTSILLTSISTLAFALSSANKATENISRSQAQVRFAELKLQEIIRNCNLIYSVSDDDIAIWLADNNQDGKINIGELVFIERGKDKDYLQLCTFSSKNSSEIALSSIDAVSTNWWSTYSSDIEYIKLIPECRNVEFKFDVSPPYSSFVNISFEMNEADNIRQYQINASLRSRKINLLNDSSSIVSDDD